MTPADIKHFQAEHAQRLAEHCALEQWRRDMEHELRCVALGLLAAGLGVIGLLAGFIALWARLR